MDLKQIWVNNYIKNVDLSKIEWIKLDGKQLKVFYEENYLDKTVWKYVSNIDINEFTPSPLGLHYLSFNHKNRDYSFLLGVVNNNINKKTIVAAMVYVENYYVFENQTTPVTFISTAETNFYFWNQGLYNKLCDQFFYFINPNQHILTTRESDIGKKYQAFNKLKDSLIKNGFEKTIWENDYLNYSNPEFYETIYGSQKKLKIN